LDILDYWVSISKDKSNLGIFQIFIYTCLYTCLVLLLCSCAFTISPLRAMWHYVSRKCVHASHLLNGSSSFGSRISKMWNWNVKSNTTGCANFGSTYFLWHCGSGCQTFNSFCNLNRHCCTQWGPIICMANLIYIP